MHNEVMPPSLPLSSLPLVLWLMGLTYFLPALLLAGIMLGVPALRRRKPTRWIGLVAAGVAALFPLSGLVTLVQFGAITGMQFAKRISRTHHLKAPQTLAGILFPAGSTIVLQQDHPDFIETGTLPVPTPVHGLLLIGTFTMGAPGDENIPGSLSGSLAQPAIIAGLPCAAAPININATFTSCILAHAVVLHGFSVAGGTYVQTRLQPAGDFLLEQASLAQPTMIFGTLYPAGTIFTPDSLSAAQAAHTPYPPTGISLACLPAAGQATLGGAVLTGPITVSYSGDAADISSDCPYRVGDQEAPVPPSSAGFGIFNQTRFIQGTYDAKTNSWSGLYNTNTPDVP